MTGKKLLSLLLCVCMVSSVFVTWTFPAMAADQSEYAHIDVDSIKAEQIYEDKTVSVSVNAPKDVTYFMFVPEEDARYLMYSMGDKYDPAGTLYDSKGDLLIDKNGGSDYDNFLIEADLYKGNTYYLACKMYSDTDTGNFDVIVTKFSASGGGAPDEGEGENPPAVEGDNINVSDILTAGIISPEKMTRSIRITEPGCTAYYTFTPETSGIYDISLIKITEEITVKLYDDIGIYITEASGASDHFNFEADLNAGTTYYLGFKYANPESIGNFTVHINFLGGSEPEPVLPDIDVTSISSTPLVLGETITADLMSGMGAVYYHFAPTESGTYSLSFEKLFCDHVWSMYTQDGYKSCEGGDSNDYTVTFDLTAGFTYYFSVTFKDPANQGTTFTRLDYIGVPEAPKPDLDVNSINATELPIDSHTECYIDKLDQMQYFVFKAPEDAEYKFEFYKVFSKANVCLYDSNGYLIDKWNFGSDSTFVQKLTQGCIYYLGVRMIDGETPTCIIVNATIQGGSEAPSHPFFELYDGYHGGFHISGSDYISFVFTPDADRTYIFKELSGNDTICRLYDADKNLLATFDDGKSTFGFDARYDYSANQKYYFEVSHFDANYQGYIEVRFDSLRTADELFFDCDSVSGYVGTNSEINCLTQPYDSNEPITWKSSDESIVAIKNGTLYFNGVGTVTITATAESGASASITVNSLASTDILLGTHKLVANTDYETNCYTFTPAKTGKYAIKIAGDATVTLVLFVLNTPGCQYYSGSEIYFSAELLAGVTYAIRLSTTAPTDNTEFTLTIKEAWVPESFVIAEESVELKTGEHYKLNAYFLPEFSYEEPIWWMSSNSNIVRVENGMLFAVSAGTVTIKAKTESGYSDSLTVTVNEPDSIYLDSPVSITFTNTETVTDTVTYKFTSNAYATHYFKLASASQKNTYEIEVIVDGNVVNNYYISGFDGSQEIWLNSGDTVYFRITCVSGIGEFKADFSITTQLSVDRINIVFINGSPEATVGGIAQLGVNHQPIDAPAPMVTWSSSNESIATVDQNGFVTFLSAGKVTITASTIDGTNLKASRTFNVTSIDSLVIGENTTASFTYPGQEIRFAFTPQEDGIYLFKSSLWSNDPYIRLYDSNMEYLDENDDANGAWGFSLSYKLVKGNLYYITVHERDIGDVVFSVTKQKSVSSISVLKSPDKSEYYSNYPDQSINLQGLELLITYEDGESFVWEYTESWMVSEYLRFSFDPSNFAETGYIVFTVGDVSVGHTFKLVDNPVSKIEIVESGNTKYFFETEGHYDYVDKETMYYYYMLKDHSDAILKVTFTDGTTETVNLGGYLLGEPVTYSNDNQHYAPWSLGSNNEVIVSYLGHTTTLYVTVEANPIDRIELSGADTIELIVEQNGFWDWRWDNELGCEVEYFRYEYPYLGNLEITIHYADGTKKTACLNEIGNYSTYDFQRNTPWVLGGEQHIVISYMNRSAYLNVLIIENPIKSIEVVEHPQLQINYGDSKYGYTSNGEYSIENLSLDGVKLMITYTTGESELVNATDIMYDGFYASFSLPRDIKEPGDYPVVINYLGHKAMFYINITESPVKSLSILKQPNNTSADYGFLPSLSGMQIGILFVDGTEKTVNVTDSNHYYDMGRFIIVDDEGNNIIAQLIDVMQETVSSYYRYKFEVSYLGASDFLDLRAPMNNDISHIEIDSFESDDNNESFTLNFTVTDVNGNKRSYSLDSFHVEVAESFDGSIEYAILAFESGVGTTMYYATPVYNNGKLIRTLITIFETTVYIDHISQGDDIPESNGGDVDGDGYITNSDVTVLIRSLCGWNESNAKYCDVNGDGKVNNRDAISLIQKVNDFKHEEIPDPTPLPDGYESLA